MEAIIFLLAPFCLCLVLMGIHCYLGLHVLQRGVIFVDLGLAQVAGLGYALALSLHLEKDSVLCYLLSLGLTLITSALLAWARNYAKICSQEVLVGIIYALSSALLVLIANTLPHGAEYLQEMMVGKILWTTWPEVIITAIIYTLVGLIHYIFRKPLMAASFNRQEKRGSAAWDFIFFSLFGVVITSSVKIAGILLVFAVLIVPALISTWFFQNIKGRLLFAWPLGFVICLLGMAISYWFDLPAGAVIVTCFTLLPIFVLPLLILFYPKGPRTLSDNT